MKVLLIKPPYTRIRGTGQAPFFPLGLGYLAASLRQAGHEVAIYHAENPAPTDPPTVTDADLYFDLRSQGRKRQQEVMADPVHPVWQEAREVLDRWQPDLVGVTMLSVEVGSAAIISSIVKERTGRPVVWGGVHPTFEPRSCLAMEHVDYVVRGEGEEALVELVGALEAGKDLADVAGLSWKRDGEQVHNPDRPPIKDIDALPLPDRSVVLFPERFDFRTLGSMIISRGCPFRCTFCSSRNFWDKVVRFRSPESVVAEMVHLAETYGTRHVQFWDDTLTFHEDITRRYCRAIQDSGLRVTWKAATRADLVSADLLSELQRSGCVKLDIGVETGSERLRELICKDVSNEQIYEAFSLINASGIGSGAFFMAGFPEETLQDLAQTFDMMKRLDAMEMSYNILDPMPGSAEYDKCRALGLLPEDPDWTDFPFWPDAHYAARIDPEVFNREARRIARWLFHRNNSLRQRVRRNRTMVLGLMRNDPGLLGQKAVNMVRRRLDGLRVRLGEKDER